MKRFRPVAQRSRKGAGAACLASVLGISCAEAMRKLGAGQGARLSELRRVLNQATRHSGLHYEIDGPFIGDPDSLETGSIVSLTDRRVLVRVDAGWMDPEGGKIRRNLPAPVAKSLVLTPELD